MSESCGSCETNVRPPLKADKIGLHLLAQRMSREAQTAELMKLAQVNVSLQKSVSELQRKLSEKTSEFSEAEFNLDGAKQEISLLTEHCKKIDNRNQLLENQVQQLREELNDFQRKVEVADTMVFISQNPEAFVDTNDLIDSDLMDSDIFSDEASKSELDVQLAPSDLSGYSEHFDSDIFSDEASSKSEQGKRSRETGDQFDDQNYVEDEIPSKKASKRPKSVKKVTLMDLFLKLANPNSLGISRWVDRNEFTGDYERLFMTNGGSWFRKGSKLRNTYNIELDRSITPGMRVDRIRLNGTL